MKKRLQTWLASIIREELERAEARASKERMDILEALKMHVEKHAGAVAEDVKTHAIQVAADLHKSIEADAKAIALFRQTSRMSCSRCGQMAWKYTVDKEAGKIICMDCTAKEEAAR